MTQALRRIFGVMLSMTGNGAMLDLRLVSLCRMSHVSRRGLGVVLSMVDSMASGGTMLELRLVSNLAFFAIAHVTRSVVSLVFLSLMSPLMEIMLERAMLVWIRRYFDISLVI